MLSEYSEEKLLPESQVRILKCLKFISHFPQSLPPEKMIVEFLKISNINPSGSIFLDGLVRLQNLMEDLIAINQFLEEVEKELENKINKLESAKSKQIKLTCDVFLKMIGDDINFYMKIASDEKFNPTKHEKLNPTHITPKDFCAKIDEFKKTDLSRWQVFQEQLKLLKRQALNPERHFNATKEALSEVAKYYLEESVVGKALITYLNTMSDDPTQGE
jgi:hypothetical protein